MYQELVPLASERTLAQVAVVADETERQSILADYHARIGKETLRRQRNDLALLEQCIMQESEVIVTGLVSDLQAWKGISHGIAKGFLRWQLQQGYAIGTINVRLGTVKAYAKLASIYGSISAADYALIRAIPAIAGREARNKDAERPVKRRENTKKAAPVHLSPVHVALLKQQPDTAIGRRDALLVCCMADLSMRVSEVCDLNVKDLHIEGATVTYYRRKVDLTQTHALTIDSLRAAQAYMKTLPEGQTALFTGKNGQRMKTRSVYDRIHLLGKRIGVEGLSPHDLRHYWATDAARNETDIKSLMEAGGWKTPAMPLHYIADSKVANEGVKLSANK